MNTKAEILKVLPGDGWTARYLSDEDGENHGEFFFELVVTFLVLRYKSGRIEVVGLVADGRKVERADKWPNFDGYAKATS